MNEVNLYDSIFGFFTQKNQLKYINTNPSQVSSAYKPKGTTIFRYVFELDNQAQRYERVVVNLERFCVVIGGLFSCFMLIFSVLLRPCIQDQLVFRVGKKLCRGKDDQLDTKEFYWRK